MIKKYALVLIVVLCFGVSGFGQTTIFNIPGGGAYPNAGWSDTNNIISEPIDKSSYFMIQPGNPGDLIVTSSYDLSAHTSATLDIDIGSFGSGTHNSLLVEVSLNGGSNYTQSYTTTATTSSTETLRTVNITSVSSNMVIRFTVNSTTGRGIRMQNIHLQGIGSASTNTEVNFSSATYSTSEIGVSINLCVDITNPSGSVATTANVVLTSSNIPHLTSPISLPITFPAGVSTQQCVSIAITDNSTCSDDTSYTFNLQSIGGGTSAIAGSISSTSLTVNDNDGSVGVFRTLSFEGADDWTYTGGGATNSTFNKYFGTTSYRLGNSNNLTTANEDISTFSNVTLIVAFASVGADSNEDLYLDISYDNGATWNGTGSVKLVDGYSNANINMGNTNGSNPTTVGTNPWVVSIPAIETQIRVRLRAVNLDGGEYYFVDDIILSGDSCLTSPLITLSSNSLTGLDYVVGAGPSPVIPSNSFDITGANLTADIILNGLTDFEISANIGGPYSTSYTIPLASANGTNTIFVRLSSALAVNTYSETVTVSSTSATNKTISLDGEVIPTLADVVITEIMYNTFGTDDDWIEICNVSGSTQYLNNYIIDVGGSSVFTFPSSVTLLDGDCIIIDLGDGGGSEYNVDCPILPIDIDYSSGLGSGTLNNTTDTITLYASNGSTVSDVVTYSSADGGNTTSLHVVNTALDNSTTSTNWQDVPDGGSAGTNSLTSPCSPIEPDINVEGNIGTFPDIAGDGSNIPVGFNNTLFAATPIGGGSQMKSYRIQNTGIVVLNIASITLSGTNPGDFSVSSVPATVNPSGVETFNITFTPTATGPRTAIVTIDSDDPDAWEDPYVFNIKGEGICASSTISVSSFAPLEGPVGTEVTITGNGFSATSTVTINGTTATVISGSATELVVEIPSITNSGPFVITEGSCYTISSSNYILTTDNSGCGLTDLIMSEIYDQNGGSLGYIEVYNGTGNTIDLSIYYIRRYGDAGDFVDDNYTDYYFTPSQDLILDGEVLYGKISTDADTATPDFDYANVSGFAGINGEDIFHLYNATTLIDVYIVPNTNIGYTATRNTNTAGPNTTSTPSDWTHSTTESTTNLGTFNYVSAIDKPNVGNPADVSGCATMAQFDATSTAGGGGALSYQWYFNEGNASDTDWEIVTPGDFPLVTVTGITGPILTLTGSFYSYEGYQFYCLVTEDGACGLASNAAQINSNSTTWTNTGWSNGVPTLNSLVIINFAYDTSVGTNNETSFQACSLTVNNGFTLTISNNTFVEVENDVTVDGAILVRTQGAFVQNNDLGNVSVTGNVTVEKETAPINIWYEYTYWSSPVSGETIGNGLDESSPTRRFWFNAANYRDSTMESANDDATDPGQDDIDDDGNDWVFSNDADPMTPGIGYAATHDPIGFIGAGSYKYIFEGPFNNGVIHSPVLRNDVETSDTDWNFIGNPYASSIDADIFLNTNIYNAGTNAGGMLEGAIYLWSHNTNPEPDANGNEVLNFATSDYATINGASETAGGDMVTPNRFIPSGQGFFVVFSNTRPTTSGNVIFNNSMRLANTTSNSQFFRSSNNEINTDNATSIDNKLWLNLTSDNGVFNQISVAYVDGATDEEDGRYYDAPRNQSTGSASYMYSTIENIPESKFVIQGKQPNSLNIDEIIPLGFYTTIDEATLYVISLHNLQGEFLSNNTMYLIDSLFGLTHNLSASDYTFTSELGDFKERFQIVFREDALSLNDLELTSNGLTIIELTDGDVKFNVRQNFVIKSVEIIDMLGRSLYQLRGNSHTEIYNLSNLSQAAYIAKVELTNGQIITKRAIKR
ncbi:hypothetical protein A9Q87_10035 [Flavobacteriales bacterium 34_180_T64]|nr:hypothetical protein A9Q87_10035 [Flavobacteriales bacterium 34_180_T64]